MNPIPVPTTNTMAVLDTNVFLDIYSCHDATETYDALYRTKGIAAIDELPVVYRRARARESLLLAALFNKMNATTFSLHAEPIALLTKNAPPTLAGGVSLASDFTTVFIYFVKDYVLPGWNATMPTEPGTAAGTDADRLLVEIAREHNVTNYDDYVWSDRPQIRRGAHRVRRDDARDHSGGHYRAAGEARRDVAKGTRGNRRWSATPARREPRRASARCSCSSFPPASGPDSQSLR
jgi:hypothetical protein